MTLTNLKKINKILVVAKDAGAANIISAFIKKKNIDAYYYLKQPALKIFKSKKISIKKKKPKKLFKDLKLLITGTSQDNKFELSTIIKAKKYNIYSVSFLDHWVNYKKRFLLNNKLILPNEIIVGDKNALTLAKKVFKSTDVRITFIPNYYFFEILKNKKNKKKKTALVLLSTNINSLKSHLKDSQIFQSILIKMDKFIKKKGIKEILIKNHPSENKKKFYDFIEKYKKSKFLKIRIINESSESVLRNYKFIAGFDTMGLVVAKLFNCKTFNLKIKGVKTIIPKKYIDMYL